MIREYYQQYKERLVNMKNRLIITILFLFVLTMVVMTAEASNRTGEKTNMTSLKADDQRVEKLRHGYITYVNNKITYYW